MTTKHESWIKWSSIRKYELILLPLVLIAIAPVLASHFSSELYSFFVFIVVFVIYAIREYDSRLLIGAAILLLTVSAIELAWGSESYANLLSIWSYYFLLSGVLTSLVEYIRYPEEAEEE
ncbi:MAG: hypothetical protein GWO20_14745 [Candidatus Korarchaeota archaeon]|nr:hypothetical protein [Candidatus Korarchaeota archaeon]NIU84665.1 hypothetical protein [Candidatus Thorarchaeota archaeon]NIW14686.1 hypothetical protein [Candidatus Thorarchaeota archaeon]NIW52757.1 hypothetical protein [Candidatus Korarchaeota archaeon]